jgi:mannose-6-phosphate isomerase-like protein (cupin superfamily)
VRRQEDAKMRISCSLALVGLGLVPAVAAAQVENMGPKAATYITDADVKKVNALPGVDRQIVSVDIGKLNTAVGIVHRGTTRKPAAPPPTGANASTPAITPPPAPPVPCGEQMASLPAVVAGTGISHDHQTETYIITSGSGTLVTGGRILNGRKSAPDSNVTLVLNGPSCSGTIGGGDVVKRVVNVGDIIVIPAGVPHGWADIPDHVDYLSVRPDPDRVLKPYVHPVLQKK